MKFWRIATIANDLVFTIGVLLALICYGQAQVHSKRFTIVEESDSHVIGTLNISDGNIYRLSPPNEMFELSGSNGELRNTVPIDRDELDSSTINLLAVATTGPVAPVEILIDILDINDNEPTFSSTERLDLTIPENAKIGSRYLLPTATDQDEAANGVSNKYKIEEGDLNKFSLYVDSSPNQQTLFYLQTEERFNRETVASYKLNISATDDGLPPLKGYLSVTVEILDNNDNAPLFDFSEYSINVNESTEIGTEILTVQATDKDEGDNGLVHYRLGAQSEGKDYFAIGISSGILTLNQSLDYETSVSHRLTLEAYDSGDPVLFGRAFVTVSVSNVNDNDPVINFRFVPTSATIASVEDNALQGTLVALITANDADAARGVRESLSLSLISGNELGHFKLIEIPNLNLWRLQVLGPIDRLVISDYNFTFLIQDGATATSRSSYKTLIVVVNSPNKHAPAFSQPTYSSLLSEIVPVGSYVANVLATDRDVGITGRLRYKIKHGNDLDWFSIEESTGLIITNRRLRHELLSGDTITLIVDAQDESANPRHSNTSVQVTIIDENDNAPMFENNLYEVSVSSGVFPLDIITLTATDADENERGKVEYSISEIKPSKILPTSSTLPIFSIGLQSGTLRLESSFTSDEVQSYDVIITATDNGIPSLTSTARVRVVVSSLDITPIFYPQRYYASVSPGVHTNTVITQVKATAHNVDTEAISYKKASGDSSFEVDPSSGVLSFNGNFQILNTFVIQINAAVNNTLASPAATVYVVVEENVPTSFAFVEPVYKFAILENSTPWLELGELKARSKDFPDAEIAYEIVDGDLKGDFFINRSSGVISTSSGPDIDYETQRLYNLSVVATLFKKDGSFSSFTTCTCTVHVKDVNDNFPRFIGAQASLHTSLVTTYEDTVTLSPNEDQLPFGKKVYNASAGDDDSGLNGNVIFSIEDALDIFDINAEGIITLKKPFTPFSNKYVNEIVCIACDQGSPRKCSRLRLAVIICRWIGKELSIAQLTNNIHIRISEKMPPNTIMAQLSNFLPSKYFFPTVVDAAGKVVTVVKYEIIGGDLESLFGIFPDGKLYLKHSRLDRETTEQYIISVQIKVFDQDQFFVVDVSVVVRVLDENDNKPVFQEAQFNFRASTNAQVDSTIGYITAEDKDNGIHASLVYTGSTGFNPTDAIKPLPFSIERYTGAVATTCGINRQTLKQIWNDSFTKKNTFVFDVKVSDNSGANLTSSFASQGIANVEIVNANNFSPQFTNQLYFTSIREDAKSGAEVIQLYASDNDGESNFTFSVGLTESDFPFSINSATGLITVSRDNALDREQQDLYTISVVVSNAGITHSSPAIVQVKVLDDNDNKPEFNESTLHWVVKEDFDVYKEIGRLEATDPDEYGPGSIVQYSLSPENTVADRQTFHIDKSSGSITLIGSLNREALDHFDLIVTAVDSGIPASGVTTAIVKVTVLDVNDNFPLMEKPTGLRITEGTYRQAIKLGVISADDADKDENGQITFQVVRKEPYSSDVNVTTNTNTGEIFVAGVVDREKYSPDGIIRVTVKASDNPIRSEDRKSSWMTFDIEVEDLNDNIPTFVTPDSIFIPARSAGVIGFEIAAVEALDPDNGLNGSVSYSLYPFEMETLFSIAPDTGNVQLSDVIPDDETIVFPMTVVARDGGVPEQYSMLEMNVIVGEPSLQNGPVFVSSSYTGNIMENEAPGTNVVTIMATGNRVNYFISSVSRTDASNPLKARSFAISSSTGLITSLLQMDREDVSSYTLTVVAVDMTSSKTNPRMTSTQVVVSVLDANDNPPLYPQPTTSELFVSESTRPGFIISYPRAIDADSSSTIEYSFQSGTGSSDFNIDSANGKLTVGAAGLDHERIQQYNLIVVASDGLHQTSTEIRIRVIDANDHAPSFPSPYFVFFIKEGFSTPPSSGRYVGSVRASDEDSGLNSMITYSFVNESNRGRFFLKPKTGSIHLNASYPHEFDRETQDLYVFRVRATDGGGLYVDTDVYVNVDDANDNSPIFHQHNGYAEIPEDADVNSHVAEVKAEDADIGLNGVVEYKLIGGNAQSHFRIDATTGVITTHKMLDRETQAVYHLVVMAMDLAPPATRRFTLTNVTINLLNVNDNAPEFIMPGVWYVPEDVEPFTDVMRIGAYDMDDVISNVTSNFRFTLSAQNPNEGVFEINAQTALLRTSGKQLNRESIEKYTLTISVDDQGTPLLASSRDITITVTDVNDNSPIFDFNSIDLSVRVSEDLAVGSEIAQLRATDIDKGFNGMVHYRLKHQSNSQSFALDEKTGLIYLSGSLDYEIAASHVLVVEGFDLGEPSLSITTNVTVEVTDVNDCSPVVSPASGVVNVDENVNAMEVMQFHLSDCDTGNGGRADFRGAMVTKATKDGVDVSGDLDNLGTLFTLSGSGQLMLAGSVDKESVDSYAVLVTAVDRGFPYLTGTASVLVVVNDVNEFDPVFQPDKFETSVTENSSIGTKVLTVEALDRDAGHFGVVRYRLLTADVPFIVDPTTGDLIISAALDREIEDTYELTVSASDDEGSSTRSSSASITIKLQDENDNEPKFSLSSYNIHVAPEKNKVCGVVSANDADQDENGEVEYSLTSGLLPFQIDLNLGLISTTSSLTDLSYAFQVRASDKGSPSNSALANVTVTVHFGPYPTFSSKPSSSVEILENTPPTNEVVHHFQATSERENSSPIRFYLAGGNKKNSFVIDHESGDVERLKSLDRESTPTFHLLVEARDSGSPSLSIFSSLTINVLDSNDNPPMFTKSLYFGTVKEDEIKSNIATVLAQDPDEAAGGMFEYVLDLTQSESPEKFDLDSRTGELKNRVSLDREEKESYFLIVLAKDKGTPSLTSETTIKVFVEDINDNPPSFTRLYSVSVKEDASIGDYVTLVTSTDLDSKKNAQNRYSLSKTLDSEMFSIDPVSGVLTIHKTLDRESQSSYNLQVNAGDSFWTAHTSVKVTVTDTNDNLPKFDKERFDMDVSSGLSAGSFLLAVAASDKDEGINSRVWYSIQKFSDFFTISHTSGEIFAATQLTCSSAPGSFTQCPRTYKLQISAMDSGKPFPLSSSTVVTINVHAENLLSPIFDFQPMLLPIAVLKSTPADTAIVNVLASDQDTIATSLKYTNVGGTHSGYFSVNATSGEVTTTKSLSGFSLSSRLTIVIRATDDGFPQKFSDFTLSVEISGENSRRPSFARRSYISPAIREDTSIGSFVTSVSATDTDDGINGEVWYSLVEEDSNKPFRVNITTGSIYVKSALDYEITPSYTLTVVAYDRAVNPKSAEVAVTIPILDVNDNPPLFNATSFVVYVSENIQPGQHITRVTATDADLNENAVVHYGIFPQDHMVARRLTGDIFAAQNTYLDYEQRNIYKVSIVATNEEGNSINDTTQLTIKVTDENEFKPQIVNFPSTVVSSVNSIPGKLLARLNATDLDGGESGQVYFVLAGWSEGKGFYVNYKTGEIFVSKNANLVLGDVVELSVFVKNPGASDPTNVSPVVLSVRIITDECLQNPCRNGGSCRDQVDGFKCECLPGYTGSLCDTEINECDSSPCKNNARCVDLVGDFKCECRVGYSGKVCDVDIDFCAQNPCLNGGTCIDGISSHSCQCSFGTTGLNCQQNSLGFEPLSYLVLSSLHESSNQIEFEFATVSSSALLLYNHAGTSQSTFVALELLEGNVRLSYNIPSASSTVRMSIGENLSDGLWHHVGVSLDESRASIVVDNCNVATDTSNSCSITQNIPAITSSPFKELTGQYIFVGGNRNTSDIISHPNQVSSYDFVGCLRNLKINSVEIESYLSPVIIESFRVTIGCSRSSDDGDACATQQTALSVCGEDATCTDIWATVLCECPSDRSGKTCQNSRVGSTFNGITYLAYSYSPEFIQEQLLTFSGALSSSALTTREKRSISNSNASSVAIRFRTRESNGLILMAKGADQAMASLVVEDGVLLYIYTTDSDFKKQQTLSGRIEDGEWHTVTIQLTTGQPDTTVTAELDGVQKLNTAFSGGIKNFADTMNVETIYLGGAPIDSLNTFPAFQGCVFSFYLNDRPQPLADDGLSSNLIVSQATNAEGSEAEQVAMGCSGRSVCASNPCFADGLYCNDIWEAYECISFGGCISLPCMNSASCRPLVNGVYECLCAANFSGNLCEVFIPCLNHDCRTEESNRQCGPVNGSAACLCKDGFAETGGVCVALSDSAGVPFWVFVICGLVAVIAVAVFVICFIRRYSITKKTKRNTSTSNGTHAQQKTPTKVQKGQTNLGRSNQSFEFDKINGNGSPPPLSHPNLFEDVRTLDQEAANFDELTSSGIGSTRSTTSSPIKDLVRENRQTSPVENNGKEFIHNNATGSLKPMALLPSYQYIMQERKESIGHSEVDPGVMILSSMQDSENLSRGTRSTPIIPSNFFDYSSDMTSSLSVHPASTESSPSQKSRPVSKSPFFSSKLYEGNKYEKASSSSQFNPSKLSYTSIGRISPTKNPSMLYSSDQGSSLQKYISGRKGGYRTSSSTYSRRVSGSVASTSTGSSSSHVSSSSPENPSIGDMVQHLNGLVGLTNEEIELLHVNPNQPKDYMSSASESMSSVPSTANNHKHFSNVPTYTTSRPSSLPGQKIQRISVETRSRTPMLLPPTSPYKPLSGIKGRYPDIPKDLQPSEFLQPPPDTSSEEEDYVFENPVGRPLSRMNECPNESSDTPFEEPPNYLKNSLHKPDLDFLMSFGTHHEKLAGVFEDLAALPAIKDDTENSSNFSSTSFITKNRARSVSSDHPKDLRPLSRNQQQVSSVSGSSFSPASVHSSTSSRSQSMNRQRQEHYV